MIAHGMLGLMFIKEISSKDCSSFLDQNHIQGKLGAKVRLGLYYNDELVSLMTFGALRKNLGQKSEDGSYELLRFCNKLNTNVVGGASKLFKHFINNSSVGVWSMIFIFVEKTKSKNSSLK